VPCRISSKLERYDVIMPNRNMTAKVQHIVVRFAAARTAVPTAAQVRGRRFSVGSVSGSRRHHSISPTAISAGMANTTRHGTTRLTSAPKAGERMGTSRNTAMISDMRRAMASPS